MLIRTVTFETHTEPRRQRQSDCDVVLEELGRVDDLDTDLGQCRICSLMHAPTAVSREEGKQEATGTLGYYTNGDCA